jgi:hypothetical protein
MRIANRKSLKYESEIMEPHAKDKEEVIEEAGTIVNKKQQQVRILCSHCKSSTHQCKTNILCAMNPKNLASKEKVYEKTNCMKKVSVTPYLTNYCLEVEIDDVPVVSALMFIFMLSV